MENPREKITITMSRAAWDVLDAIAVSFALRIEGEVWERVPGRIRDEWKTLHENGIVPQKPIMGEHGGPRKEKA